MFPARRVTISQAPPDPPPGKLKPQSAYMQTRSSPSLQTLHRLARHVALDGYEQIPKSLLYSSLKSKFKIDRFLRLERRSHATSRSTGAKSKRKPLYSVLAKKMGTEAEPPTPSGSKPLSDIKLNSHDPIMFVPIGKSKTFVFTRPNGTKVQFLVDSLVDYLLATGDFTDPETRIPFSDDDLRRIDQLVHELALEKQSVLTARHDANRYSDAKFRRDALLGLERCAGEVIADMLDLVETYDPDEAQMQLLTEEFPVFLDFFRQLREGDAEYASKCIAHWRLFIAGPPNKPNCDDCGLIRFILRYLKSCEEGQV